MVIRIFKIPCLLFAQLIVVSAFAQSALEGIIVNHANEEPIPFVSIAVKNKATGTISNEDGKFKLDTRLIEEADTIQVSHISYLTSRFTFASLKANKGKISLDENVLTLKEVTFNSKQNDIDLLQEIIAQSKKKLMLPFTYNLYYREWVRENASYNRFADGLLVVNYPLNKEDVKVQVTQSRAFKLPKDDDEIFDIVSPLKMELVLNNVYIDFLNRYREEKSKDYDIVSYPGVSFDDYYTFVIEPKKNLIRDESKILYKAKLKIDQGLEIREVEIKSDSLSSREKSILGLRMKFLGTKTSLSFKKINGQNCLAYARMEVRIKSTYRKKVQIDNYTSEFILLDRPNESTEIVKKNQFKKSALYKNGNAYTRNFWEGLEMPLLSEEERKVIELLAEKCSHKSSN